MFNTNPYKKYRGDVMLKKDFSKVVHQLEDKQSLGLTGNTLKTIKWLVLANAAVIISLGLISGGNLIGLAPYLLILGSVFPLGSLVFSKALAKKAHNIVVLKEGYFQTPEEESLYRLVENLSYRAGIEKMPEVGIYHSPDMNAFATGMNRNNSIVAFSTALLEKMDEESIAAVAAHEVAHIANGDMITLSIVQGVINAIVLLITIPLSFIKLAALFSEDVGALAFWIIALVKMVITAIALFLGNLVVKAFSRRREFEADALAAQLVDKESMIGALKLLSRETIIAPKEQAEYAAFKISSPEAWLDIFSTHPSIERRIEKLQNLQM